MTAASWNVSGQYYETCNCDFVCPCILQQMTVTPSKRGFPPAPLFGESALPAPVAHTRREAVCKRASSLMPSS